MTASDEIAAVGRHPPLRPPERTSERSLPTSHPRSSELSVTLLLAIVAAMVLAVLTPLIAFAILRRVTALSGLDAATVAAHDGSASLVTFLAPTNFLAHRGPHWSVASIIAA